MFERIKNWEKYPLSQILFDLQKFYYIDTNTTIEAGNCESGVWVTVKIALKGKNYVIQGSRLDIIRDRLIAFLDKHGVRDAVLS